jgi:hypothetical protein
MQFLTVRHRQSGTEKHARQFGGWGAFFEFDYEVIHDPMIERVGVRLGRNVGEYCWRELWPDIQYGVRLGFDQAERQGVRLCCINILIAGTEEHVADTSNAVVMLLLVEFVRSRIVEWAEPLPPLRAEWLTSDVVALARGIDATAALDGLPALTDALLEAGCADPLVIEHLQTCTDHAPSCWVVEMIRAQAAARGSTSG